MIPRTARITRSVLAAVLVALGAVLAGCETAPATGRSFFTGGMSAKDEVALGAKEHKKILPQFGGAYEEAGLNTYVGSIGNLLTKTSESPDLRFTFTILDSPIVNAFALPGGYVYVTRGLMALANDEAELAGVLAHEIGHVTARHSAERYGQATAARLAQVGLGILFGGAASDAAGMIGGVALKSFSREQEHEADLLGIRYLARAGYDPRAMASFLKQLLADSRLSAEMAGQAGKADEFNIMQTHPRTADRVEAALREAKIKTVKNPMRAPDIYLNKIDGMLFGDSPNQGIVRGRSFLHAELGFAFEVPPKFALNNSPRAVAARGPKGSVIIFDRGKAKGNMAMTAYLTQIWGTGSNLRDVEAITVNGMAAATGRVHVETKRGPRDVRLVAYRYDAKTIYRMLFVVPPELSAALAGDLRRVTYSFRKLNAREAAAIKPLRLRIHKVHAGESLQSLAARAPFESYALPRLQALNGLGPDAKLWSGQRIKIVAE